MREAEILVAVREAVCKLPGVRVWRNSTGVGVGISNPGVVRYGLGVGSADLVGICRSRVDWQDVTGESWYDHCGRFFAIEVKSARGRTSPEQDAWGRCVRELGGFYAVVRSVDDAFAAVERCRRGELE